MVHGGWSMVHVDNSWTQPIHEAWWTHGWRYEDLLAQGHTHNRHRRWLPFHSLNINAPRCPSPSTPRSRICILLDHVPPTCW